jgi:hypothetical protein
MFASDLVIGCAASCSVAKIEKSPLQLNAAKRGEVSTFKVCTYRKQEERTI